MSLKKAIFTLYIFLQILPLSVRSDSSDIAQGADILQESSKAFINVAKEAIPAVVFIKTKVKASSRNDFLEEETLYNPFNDEYLKKFGLSDICSDSYPYITCKGSGFIISSDGYILTNNHVVDRAESISVVLNDKRELTAVPVGLDPNSELAVIKVKGENFPYLELADSNNIEIGEWVVAIGSPFEFSSSLTVGVVSAKGRSNLNITKWEDFIQTDAAINFGNSGGPLLNIRGKVVGINTAFLTRAGAHQGISFAVPSNIAKHVSKQLITKGNISHGYLGILLQTITADLAEAFNLSTTQGVIIVDVTKDAPSEKSGLLQGDIILSYDGTEITTINSFRSAIAHKEPGTTLELLINRKGKEKKIYVKIGLLPADIVRNSILPSTTLGLTLENLTADFSMQLDYPLEEGGVVIIEVEPGSSAERKGLRPGCLIIGANRKKITNIKELKKSIKENPGSSSIILLVKSGYSTQFLTIEKR